MADLEKVLNGLEHCIKKLDSVIDNTHGFDCISCSYFRKCESIGHLVGLPLMLDALALLKDKKPKMVEDVIVIGCKKSGYCPDCKRLLNSQSHPNYCGECGRKAKWD